MNKHWPAIARVTLWGLLTGCAGAPPATDHDIPAALAVAPDAVLKLSAHGAGAQIYRCRADKDDPSRFSWTLKEPQADLFDRAGHRIGKHYAGPTWEAKDGSLVIGEVVARASSPDPQSIAWLLLKAKSTAGTGLFASVRFIQRVRTVGGDPPVDGCDQSAADREVRVAYSAEYRFYD